MHVCAREGWTEAGPRRCCTFKRLVDDSALICLTGALLCCIFILIADEATGHYVAAVLKIH